MEPAIALWIIAAATCAIACYLWLRARRKARDLARAMIGPGDLAIRDLDDAERGCRTCRECDSLYSNEEDRAGLCHGCADRLRPLCTCGCEEEATMVADLYVDGEHDCRAPWLSIEHALGATDTNHPVDVRPLDPLADIIAAGPCWCALVETTVCFWCPAHGVRI